MQDIESHTIVYLRSLLATRAIDDPDVATFLACWVHEETFHGLALERFLAAAGHPLSPRPKPHGHENFPQWLEARSTAILSKLWPDFCAVHMTWGAINELTALTGYRLLAARARHPVLTALLEHIQRDEARHFFFYYRQAEIRLQRPAAAKVSRFLVDRFWGPVGSGVQLLDELRFMAGYLFGDEEVGAAAPKLFETTRRLPCVASVRLLDAWLDRFHDGEPNRGRSDGPLPSLYALPVHARRARHGDDPVRGPALAHRAHLAGGAGVERLPRA